MVTDISRLNLILSAALMTSLHCKLYNVNILQIRKIKILFTYLIASEDRKCASGRDFSIRLSDCCTRHAIARTRRVRQGTTHECSDIELKVYAIETCSSDRKTSTIRQPNSIKKISENSFRDLRDSRR